MHDLSIAQMIVAILFLLLNWALAGLAGYLIGRRRPKTKYEMDLWHGSRSGGTTHIDLRNAKQKAADSAEIP